MVVIIRVEGGGETSNHRQPQLATWPTRLKRCTEMRTFDEIGYTPIYLTRRRNEISSENTHAKSRTKLVISTGWRPVTARTSHKSSMLECPGNLSIKPHLFIHQADGTRYERMHKFQLELIKIVRVVRDYCKQTLL